MKRLPLWLALLPLLWTASVTRADSDARDIDGVAFAPNNTVVALGYFRHENSTEDLHVTNTAIFRMLYLMRFGNLVIAPVDLAQGVADYTGYRPVGPILGAISPALANVPLNLSVSGAGFADLVYLPSFSYVIPQAGANHTIIQFNPRFTLPTGNYDATKPVNIGNHRFTFTPYIGIAQRFLQQLTVEAYGALAIHTSNSDFIVPASGMTPAVKTKSSQSPDFIFDAHLGYDMSRTFFVSASYYLLKDGNIELGLPGSPTTKEPTIQSLRFNFGIRIEKGTLVMLQFNQDIAASHGGEVSRWFGARISHVFFDESQASVPTASTSRPPEPAPAR
jgi:hypothetical protein